MGCRWAAAGRRLTVRINKAWEPHQVWIWPAGPTDIEEPETFQSRGAEPLRFSASVAAPKKPVPSIVPHQSIFDTVANITGSPT